ncbi:efflux RND transporter periplasmic adaptor subunit [Pusillimonas sp. CC-YST705]|uniref:Efflux RND transporter periplasmic adaptor subunit n=1 Tax=Mesopusillimonas faecipullorum TaxID=2755040 RepID=A0ABS8CAV6_9BURK|nr:efflux RND transporter periplasmic adaptor subunit [Mesopusillimonas faecipullorum]MCB5363161.1 efflux RND transporter periplasmic adaptor subunit [Mesopusillimonas faecipullorum]
MRKASLPLQQKFRVLALTSVLLLAACGDKPKQGPDMANMQVPVSVVTVQPSRAEISVELPGRVSAIKDAQIRARVDGIVESINFKQGGDVKAGDLLFTIDPAPYQAARASAYAELKRAEANAISARQLAQRYSKLIQANAVSRQDYDNAVAQAAQADAAIAAAKAALQAADINLGYTKVTSPINGRIGQSMVTEGALVSAAAATQMAVVQQIDDVYVDVTRSTTELAAMRRDLASGRYQRTEDGAAQARVVLEDGSLYDQDGEMLFSGISVDPGTGQVTIRSEFPNPEQILLPGMYVRVRLPQAVDVNAMLVPQQALQRAADGSSSLMVVVDGKVQVRPVEAGISIGSNWLINKGLAAGDVVIVAGFQKLRPGAPVQAMPWKPEAANGAAQGAAPAQPDQAGAAPSGESAPGQAADGGAQSK